MDTIAFGSGVRKMCWPDAYARDSLNGPYDDDGNQTPDVVDFAFCPKADTDPPLVVALQADSRVLKESAPGAMTFEDTGSHWV